MVSETSITSLLLDAPARPEPSFQVSHIESDAPERFDHLLKSEVNTPASRPPEPRDRQEPSRPSDSPQYTEKQKVASVSPEPPRPASDPEHESQDQPSGDPSPRGSVNPFALPIERLNAVEEFASLPETASAAAFDAIAELAGTQNTAGEANASATASLDSFKEALAALNIDPETIGLLAEALQNGDAAGLQGILNALRGLLQASAGIMQAPGVEASGAAAAGASRNQPEQLALALLMRAGLTQEEAQQVIQQARSGQAPQPLNETSSQFAKSIADAVAPKTLPDNSNGSGTLQNSGQEAGGSTKQHSDAPRNLAGLTGDRLETISNLVSPDKAGAPATNPLLAKGAVSPLLSQTGAPQGILAEAAPGQAPAALAEAAARGADFVKPAVTETYNGRAAMDKPITAQIIEKFSLRGFGNQREVHIKLDPPSLGTVRMNVSTSGDSVRATIVAENHIVKSVIENNLAQLKDSIAHQGVKIDSFNVLVGGNASHSAEGHRAGLEFLDQLGRDGGNGPQQAEEIITLHRPLFVYDNQSISLFA